MAKPDRYSTEAKRILRAAMIRNGLSYEDMIPLLKQVGLEDSVANLRNKISRGRFSASFFLQFLEAVNATANAPQSSNGYNHSPSLS